MALMCRAGGPRSSVLTLFSCCPHSLSLARSLSPWALVPAGQRALLQLFCSCVNQQVFAEYLLFTLKRLGGMVLESDDLSWHTSCVLSNIRHHNQLLNLGVIFIF